MGGARRLSAEEQRTEQAVASKLMRLRFKVRHVKEAIRTLQGESRFFSRQEGNFYHDPVQEAYEGCMDWLVVHLAERDLPKALRTSQSLSALEVCVCATARAHACTGTYQHKAHTHKHTHTYIHTHTHP
jgi:hypothetical protein